MRRLSLSCESTAEERSAADLHATFCGSREWATAPGNPVEEETELSQTGLRRRGESPANRHREATVTAPLLDSTHLNPKKANKQRKLV